MKETLKSDRPIISYLLGESSAEERAEIEHRCFSDRDFLEQVLAVEDDLIDAYLRGGLTARERGRFESHFLASADRRDKLETAEALLKYLRGSGRTEAAAAQEARSWKQSLSGLLRPEGLAMRIVFTSIILAVIGVLWLFLESRRWRAPLQQAQVEKGSVEKQRVPEQKVTAPAAQDNQPAQETEPKKSAVETPKQKPASKKYSASGLMVASFVLTPGLTRDAGGTNKLVIPRRAQFVQLRLSVDSVENYKSYRASLQRVGGTDVWSNTIKNGHSERGGKSGALKSIMLRLPASLLGNGEYLLTVSGTTVTGESEIAGDYPFTVARQE